MFASTYIYAGVRERPLSLCSILGTADLVPHSLFAICGLVDEDAETIMGSV